MYVIFLYYKIRNKYMDIKWNLNLNNLFIM